MAPDFVFAGMLALTLSRRTGFWCAKMSAVLWKPFSTHSGTKIKVVPPVSCKLLHHRLSAT